MLEKAKSPSCETIGIPKDAIINKAIGASFNTNQANVKEISKEKI